MRKFLSKFFADNQWKFIVFGYLVRLVIIFLTVNFCLAGLSAPNTLLNLASFFVLGITIMMTFAWTSDLVKFVKQTLDKSDSSH